MCMAVSGSRSGSGVRGGPVRGSGGQGGPGPEEGCPDSGGGEGPGRGAVECYIAACSLQ